MPNSVRPFLMFQGNVGSGALDFYQSVFPGCEAKKSVERYSEGDGPPPGSLKMARLNIAGQSILFARHSHCACLQLHARHFALRRVRLRGRTETASYNAFRGRRRADAHR